MKARLNDNASGVWAKHSGLEVEIIERSLHGLSSRIKLPDSPALADRAGRKVWMPTSWLDEQDEP